MELRTAQEDIQAKADLIQANQFEGSISTATHELGTGPLGNRTTLVAEELASVAKLELYQSVSDRFELFTTAGGMEYIHTLNIQNRRGDGLQYDSGSNLLEDALSFSLADSRLQRVLSTFLVRASIDDEGRVGRADQQRDPATLKHLLRVGVLAGATAMRLGMTSEEVALTVRGGMLHDCLKSGMNCHRATHTNARFDEAPWILPSIHVHPYSGALYWHGQGGTTNESALIGMHHSFKEVGGSQKGPYGEEFRLVRPSAQPTAISRGGIWTPSPERLELMGQVIAAADHVDAVAASAVLRDRGYQAHPDKDGQVGFTKTYAEGRVRALRFMSELLVDAHVVGAIADVTDPESPSDVRARMSELVLA